MAKLSKDERLRDFFTPHLKEGENLICASYGVKQPHIGLIILLIALAVLPGVIAVAMLTKNYVVGLTNRRMIVLRVGNVPFKKGQANHDAVKEITEYSLENGSIGEVKTSTGAIFTHINIKDPEKPFKAKFHRAFSSENRESAIKIAEAVQNLG